MTDFREPHAPFTGRNSLTDHKRNFSCSLLNQGGGRGNGKNFDRDARVTFLGLKSDKLLFLGLHKIRVISEG